MDKCFYQQREFYTILTLLYKKILFKSLKFDWKFLKIDALRAKAQGPSKKTMYIPVL